MDPLFNEAIQKQTFKQNVQTISLFFDSYGVPNKIIPLTITTTHYLHPFKPHAGSFKPSNMQRSCTLYCVYGSMRPTTEFDYPKS